MSPHCLLFLILAHQELLRWCRQWCLWSVVLLDRTTWSPQIGAHSVLRARSTAHAQCSFSNWHLPCPGLCAFQVGCLGGLVECFWLWRWRFLGEVPAELRERGITWLLGVHTETETWNSMVGLRVSLWGRTPDLAPPGSLPPGPVPSIHPPTFAVFSPTKPSCRRHLPAMLLTSHQPNVSVLTWHILLNM
jgi:hypothetical protein